jgi:hypothetical protein
VRRREARRRWFRFIREERGDVLFEYVLLTVGVLLPLVGAAALGFNPGGATFTTDGTLAGDNYGVFGNALVESLRRILCGLSLPVP